MESPTAMWDFFYAFSVFILLVNGTPITRGKTDFFSHLCLWRNEAISLCIFLLTLAMSGNPKFI